MLKKCIYKICTILIALGFYLSVNASESINNKYIYKDYQFPEIKAVTPHQKADISDSIRCVIKGKTLGVFDGMMQDYYMETHFDNPKINIYNDVSDGVLSIIHKKVDFFIMFESLADE